MANLLTQRADELRLLGWTDEGANRYAAISDDPQIQFAFSSPEALIVLVGGSIVLGILAFMGIRLFISNKKLSDDQSLSFVSDKEIFIDSIKSLNLENLSAKKNQAIVRVNSYSKDHLTIDSLISFFKMTSIDTDKLIIHFLMVFSLGVDAFIYSWDLCTNNLDKPKKNVYNKNFNPRLKEALELKSEDDLKLLINGSELLENLDRNNLIELIQSNSIYLNRFVVEERRLVLKAKKNSELRNLLKGVDRLSRLNKSQLIDKIILIEFGEIS